MSRKRFNREFKIQVVKRVLEEGKTATAVAKSLELSRNMVSRWVKEYEAHGDQAFTGSGNAITDQEFEIRKLQKRIEQLEQERDILKKFQAFLKE
jgi:transposase